MRFGAQPTVPDALVGHYFRVESTEEQSDGVVGFVLSGPYLDPDCTLPCPEERMSPRRRTFKAKIQTSIADARRGRQPRIAWAGATWLKSAWTATVRYSR